MHRKLIKLVQILVILVVLFSLAQNTYATDTPGGQADAVTYDPITIAAPDPNYSGTSTLTTLGNTILGIIQAIGAGVAVIATLVLAIRYMYSAPDEKAEVKKKLIPFIIGGVLVFGATTLAKLVEMYVNDIL